MSFAYNKWNVFYLMHNYIEKHRNTRIKNRLTVVYIICANNTSLIAREYLTIG